MNRRITLVAVAGAICVCLLVGLNLRGRTGGKQAGGPTQTGPVSFEEAKSRAFEAIRLREQWPQTPEAVCKAFWDARTAKDYGEMAVLWPGSDSFDWPRLCRDDPNVAYVFGPSNLDGTRVPYAPRDRFDAQGTYDMTMQLGVLQTRKGPRHYIVSGN